MTEGWPHGARFISKKLCHLEKGLWNLLIKQKSLLAVRCSCGKKKYYCSVINELGVICYFFLSVLTPGQVCINGICQVHTYILYVPFYGPDHLLLLLSICNQHHWRNNSKKFETEWNEIEVMKSSTWKILLYCQY